MTMWSEWPAPAKLNLFLNIVGRRADGYHLLQTVFQILDWGDSIRIRPRADDRVVRIGGLDDVPPEKDLAIRAANLLREHSGSQLGADIEIRETHAGRRRSRRRQFRRGDDARRIKYSLELRRVRGRSRRSRPDARRRCSAVRARKVGLRGRNRRKTHADRLPPRHYVIVDPGVHSSTAELFQAPELTRNSPATTITNFLDGACTGNAFTPLVRARFPEVAAALEWLESAWRRATVGQRRMCVRRGGIGG